MPGDFASFCLLIFFKIIFFKQFFQKYHPKYQTVWTQIRPNKMSGLIWVQTVCKGHQQTTLAFLCYLLIFFNISFQNSLQEEHQCIKQFGSRSRMTFCDYFVDPDLGLNCLQWLSADNTSRQRVQLYNKQKKKHHQLG